MLVLGECGRVLAGVGAARPPARDGDPQRLARRRADCSAAGHRRAPGRLPARRPPDDDRARSGQSTRRAASSARPRPAASPRRRRRDSVSGELSPSCPTLPAPTCWSASRMLDGKPVGVAIEADAAGVSASRRSTRYDATRSLGHVTLDDAPAMRARRVRGVARGRLAPRPGADRRRVARQRRNGARRVRRLRQGALHVRPRDRLLPGRQALAHRGAAPARERPLAALLRRLGAPRSARRVPARRQRRALGRRPRARPRPRAR